MKTVVTTTLRIAALLALLLAAACTPASQGGTVDRAALATTTSFALAESERGYDVVLLRGGFDVFSNGLDTMGADLRRRGVAAQVVGYKQWQSVVAKIVARTKRGQRRPIALVGHSFGANAVLRMAAELQKRRIPVDYIATFAATNPPPVPANVRKVANYYQTNGWGEKLRTQRGFRGNLRNIDLARARAVTHFNIEKQPKLQSQVIGNILRAVGRARRS